MLKSDFINEMSRFGWRYESEKDGKLEFYAAYEIGEDRIQIDAKRVGASIAEICDSFDPDINWKETEKAIAKARLVPDIKKFRDIAWRRKNNYRLMKIRFENVKEIIDISGDRLVQIIQDYINIDAEAAETDYLQEAILQVMSKEEAKALGFTWILERNMED